MVELQFNQKEAVTLHDLLHFVRTRRYVFNWDPEAIEVLRILEIELHQTIGGTWPELKTRTDA